MSAWGDFSMSDTLLDEGRSDAFTGIGTTPQLYQHLKTHTNRQTYINLLIHQITTNPIDH